MWINQRNVYHTLFKQMISLDKLFIHLISHWFNVVQRTNSQIELRVYILVCTFELITGMDPAVAFDVEIVAYKHDIITGL